MNTTVIDEVDEFVIQMIGRSSLGDKRFFISLGSTYLHTDGLLHQYIVGGGWYSTPKECYDAIELYKQQKEQEQEQEDQYYIGFRHGYAEAMDNIRHSSKQLEEEHCSKE